MRTVTGLKRGDIETHINGIVELHFNLIKNDLEIENPLFNALKELVTTNDINFAVGQAQKKLSQKDFEDYDLVSSIMLDPKRTFRILPLSDRDLTEVRYAMQKHLFQCLEELIKLKEVHSQKTWLSQTQNILQQRFLALPTRQILPPDYSLAKAHAAKLCYGLFTAIAATIISYQINDVLQLVQSSNIESPYEKAFLIGSLVFLVGYAVFRLLPSIGVGTILAKNSFFNLQDSLKEKVLPRTIFAKPPASDQTWEEALKKEVVEHQSQLSNG